MKRRHVPGQRPDHAPVLESESPAYQFGYDAGLNGANTVNCHFALFSSPESTHEWERGNTDGKAAKAKR